eukprot:CAMPEP_0118640518 /NCGR_PEP_ID=MMETSP0785-20121206/4797_1 /TAXON_ID=91992 /ORGANISM="Bolidomonas pacifica, Strain CCMP 1866" /LENGTH=836 /DNA_ID=CAMNT_0006531913 /DNA_START=794 /DNA_END=3301 /DNA_ORIENTATION=-
MNYDWGSSVTLETEVQESFMTYAMSIILGRALPDARDGLKPVHRRILYSMNGLNLVPSSGHRKCGRVVGEVLGKYHPHGDMAIYDALVRLAQDFSTAHPLIDGHGNFGSIDADPPAAMRYTECKLTKVTVDAMLDGVEDEGVVQFQDNFDGNEVEPVVLPAKLPFLLLNGASGIAVGMATNIPPHNLGELTDACVAMLESRERGGEIEDAELLDIVKGPDFPTGSKIMGTDAIKKLYTTGHGGIVQRATCHVETSAGSRPRSSIVCTELPYQVNKANLLEKIAEYVNDKKIDGISDLRDESDRDGIRVVIELKKDAVPAVVQNNLYKKTQLQSSFSGNFLALMGGGKSPQRFTLRSALDEFLNFRFETVRNKVSYDLKKALDRNHIVEGLLKALTSVDYVIEIIRNAPHTQSARLALMDETDERLSLTREQADAVLKLQLGQLTRLNGDKLSTELATLREKISSLNKLMEDDSSVRKEMITELLELKEKYAIPRRTRVEADVEDLEAIDLIKNSKSVIVMTKGGYIKRMPLSDFKSQQRGTRGKTGVSAAKSKASDDHSENDDNTIEHCFSCNDHDTLIFSTLKGIAYGLRAFQIPVAGRTARGVPLPSVLPVTADDTVASVLPVPKFTKDEFIVLATERGWIKKTPLAAFENLTSRGLIIASLEDGDSLKWISKCTDEMDVFLGSKNGMATRYSASLLRPTARTSRGVRSMKLRPGDGVAEMSIMEGEGGEVEGGGYVLAVTKKGYGKRIPITEFRSQGRGGIGVIAIKFKEPVDGDEMDSMSCLTLVKEDDEILVTTKRGVIVRQKCSAIPVQSRTATGVRVQKVDKGEYINSV